MERLPAKLGRHILIGDADRDSACAQLREHYAADRIDEAELDRRLALIVRARTVHDLRTAFRGMAWHHVPGAESPASPPGPHAPRSVPGGGAIALRTLIWLLLLVGGTVDYDLDPARLPGTRTVALIIVITALVQLVQVLRPGQRASGGGDG